LKSFIHFKVVISRATRERGHVLYFFRGIATGCVNVGKIGYSKPEHSSKADEVTHQHVDGPAYEIENPIQKLIHVVGTFFSEPTYYAENKPNKDGLTEQAQGVVDAAHALAEASPEDLLVIAAWARDPKEGLKLRTTPQVLFAIAAAHKDSRNHLVKYARKVMWRADDIRTAFASYNHLFVPAGSKRTLPVQLKRSLALALSQQTAYSLIKYNTDTHPTFRDVVAMVKGSKSRSVVKDTSTGYPIPKGLYEYLAFGKVTEDAPDIVRLRQQFFQNKDVTKVTLEDVNAAGLTWENCLSHFGNTPAVWRLCLPVMGEMALTRNLRNFEQANFGKDDWDVIETALLPFDEVDGVLRPRKTVQLPFRFLSAYRYIYTGRSKSIVAKAFDRSIASVPDLPGKSVTFTDNSGSMQTAVSKDSTISLKDAGNALGAILAKKNGDSIDIHTFGDFVKRVDINYIDSGITILEKIDAVGNTTGHGTNIDAIEQTINEYTKRGEIVNRFIILSDMCCYHFGGYIASRTLGGMQRAFDEYRRKVHKDCYLYSVNLAGYGQAQVKPEDNNVIIMSGWSESIIRLMLDAENSSRETPRNTVLPTIEQLRIKYKAV
jgi:hypothetical protein